MNSELFGIISTQFNVNFSRQEHQIDVFNGIVQKLRTSAFYLYPLSFFLYSPFKYEFSVINLSGLINGFNWSASRSKKVAFKNGFQKKNQISDNFWRGKCVNFIHVKNWLMLQFNQQYSIFLMLPSKLIYDRRYFIF